MKLIRFFSIVPFLLVLFISLFTVQTESKSNVVYIVPVEETVEKGLYSFLTRAVEAAEKDQADAIIFQINTPGGVVDAAGKIGQLLTSTPLRTIAFIDNQALSAGAFIALNTDEIYMVPSGTMGAAAIIDGAGNMADTKAQSYWLSALKAAAEQNGRDPIYAQAMADVDIDLPKYGAPKGKLLTLTSDQAEEIGYSEGTVKNLSELMSKLDLENAKQVKVEESFAEKLARFITHPVVIPILLSLGSLGLILELYSPGFGIPGFVGLSSLLLFFYGHLVAGLAGLETLILFVVGIGLVLLELFLPGGIAGIFGFIAILASLFLASDNVVHMGISILIAIVVSITASILMVKVFGRKMKFFKKIILTDSTNTKAGYVSNENRSDLIGKEGITLTPLRPAGTMVIGDERIDVVSEGSFIAKNVIVKVVKTEGARIVVREVEMKHKEEVQ